MKKNKGKKRKTLIGNVLSKKEDSYEIKRLKQLKRKVKKFKTAEELDEIEY